MLCGMDPSFLPPGWGLTTRWGVRTQGSEVILAEQAVSIRGGQDLWPYDSGQQRAKSVGEWTLAGPDWLYLEARPLPPRPANDLPTLLTLTPPPTPPPPPPSGGHVEWGGRSENTWPP